MQKAAGIGHQPQGQGFAQRALRAQTGRQADIGRQLGRGRGGGLDPVVDRPHAVAAQMMVDIDDGRPGKAAFQSRGQIVAQAVGLAAVQQDQGLGLEGQALKAGEQRAG